MVSVRESRSGRGADAYASTPSTADPRLAPYADQRTALATRAIGAPEIGELVRRDRLAEVEALDFIAGVAAQKAELFIGFDAFGHHRQAERLAHCDDGLRDRLVFGVERNVADERAVDLQRIDREALELGER